MNQKTKPYRHELKYFISKAEMAELELRMRPYFHLDRHAGASGYMIRSLYFDDIDDSAYEEKYAGVFARKKYRIRFYNCKDNVIHLERKKKAGNYIYKESAPITHAELEQIMAGDYSFLLERKENFMKEFYFECVAKMLRPRVIVDYDRMPYVLDEGTVRITFDEKVRGCGPFVGDLFDEDLPTMEVLPAGKLILEVKYTEFCPQIVRSLLPPKAEELTAASKYVLCCDKINYLHGPFYWEESEERPW